MYVYVYIIVYVYIYILLMVMKVTYYEISKEKNPISVFHPLRPDLPASIFLRCKKGHVWIQCTFKCV